MHKAVPKHVPSNMGEVGGCDDVLVPPMAMMGKSESRRARPRMNEHVGE